MAFKKVNPKLNIPEVEKEVLSYWEKNSIFKKSVELRPVEKTFSFYDGPPFATGTPHYGHLVAGTIKDVIPRFKTMQGYRVERIWGWDTHGLPIENIVEQELDFNSRIQIEKFGVDKFNEKCKSKVLEYADEWEKIIGRTGRWVDMKNAYLTMDFAYMESVWWVFKTLWDKKLIYKGHRVMPYCPRCATGLSAFEVGMPGSYQDRHDKAITVKFESVSEPGTYFLAWTTTPWTLPGNLALAVGPKITYLKIEKGGKKYILAQEALEKYEELRGAKILEKFKGKELIGQKYKPVFSYYKNPKKAYEVVAGDYVTTEDGTGIVHTAPAFGEEDYKVAKENGLDFFMPVNDLGQFEVEVPEYSGRSVVEFETNEDIIKDLGDKVLKIEEITHSYPHCWRCDTPLIYKAIDSWFVAVTDLKDKLLKINKKIHWVPKSVGEGRFGNLLTTAPDWNISRNRFWGTPLPVWECKKCHKITVFGNGKELSEASGKAVTDFHLHYIRDIEVSCDCGGKASLSGEVLDCWFESGSMPYASVHYPFENQEKFKRDFPADFIAEGIDQTRGWFNSLLILSTALFDDTSYKNVVVNGTVLAEDGQKMSKRLKNYPEVEDILGKYGADAMRFYLMSAPVVKAGDLNFSEKGVDEVVKSLILRLWNSYSFFVTYASLDNFEPTGKLSTKNVLDRWLLSVTNKLVKDVTLSLEKYDISKSAKLLAEYMDELSNWYIRRSRKRFWKSENDNDKLAAYETLHFALLTYVKLLAPFTPFVTDEIYRNLSGEKESVHLDNWPEAGKKLIDTEIEKQMKLAREMVEAGLSQRNEQGVKVRQPLSALEVTAKEGLPAELENIILEEVNVKTLKLIKGSDLSVKLDTKITPELRAEGIARDFIRLIQDGRKKAGFNVEDRILTGWETGDQTVSEALASQADYIAKETLSVKFESLDVARDKYKYSETVKLNGAEVWLGISRKK